MGAWLRGGAVLALALGTMSLVLPGPAAAQDGTPQPSFPVMAVFVNGMTSFETVDVDLNDDDNRIVEGLDYGEVSEPVELTSPASNIIVKEPRNMQFDRWLFNTIVPTQAGQTYVITISDVFIIPVQVDLAAAAAGGAHARLVHGSSQTPALDVFVGDQATPVITNLRYGSASDTGEVAAGTYDLKLNQTGMPTLVLSAPTTIEAGQAYTLVLIGKPGSTEQPLTLLTVTQPLGP
jgi:hypothetical protein